MKRAIARIILVAAVCGVSVYGQNAGAKTTFEVASVKPSPPPTPGTGMRVSMRGGPGTNDPGRVTFENFSLSNLVTIAYGIDNYQLAGGEGLDSFRFDITAKIPDGATRDDFRLMMQNLLAERFRLSVHHQTKEIQTWELTVGKNGPKLTSSVKDVPPPDAAPQAPRAPPKLGSDGFPVLPPGPGMVMMNGRARMQMTKTTMEQLAGRLAGQLGRPVTDATGLKGEYDFSLYWVTDSMRSAGAPSGASQNGGPAAAEAELDSGPTLPMAVQDQLGLKLAPTKGQVDVVVIDHIEKVPTEN
jgi:uncharacterized protein (TIGR03435 family)